MRLLLVSFCGLALSSGFALESGGARIIGLQVNGNPAQASGKLTAGKFIVPGQVLETEPNAHARFQFMNRALMMLGPASAAVFRQARHDGLRTWDGKGTLPPGLATQISLSRGLLRVKSALPGAASGLFLEVLIGGKPLLVMAQGADCIIRILPAPGGGIEVEIFCLQEKILIRQPDGKLASVVLGQRLIVTYSLAMGFGSKVTPYQVSEVVGLLQAGGSMTAIKLLEPTREEVQAVVLAMAAEGRLPLSPLGTPAIPGAPGPGAPPSPLPTLSTAILIPVEPPKASP
jgi:hypothetical protein